MLVSGYAGMSLLAQIFAMICGLFWIFCFIPALAIWLFLLFYIPYKASRFEAIEGEENDS